MARCRCSRPWRCEPGWTTSGAAALRRRLRRLLDLQSVDRAELEALGRLRVEWEASELLVSVVSPAQLRTTLAELFDESSFLSPYGLRSLSKRYDHQPYAIVVDGARYEVDYEPAESTTPMYGGNSNWRGPIWLPMNYLVIRSLTRFHHYVGAEFTVEYPTGSGRHRNLLEIAQDLADRVTSIFLRVADGTRPAFGGTARFQQDPAWDNLLFFEYFHGDNGAGLWRLPPDRMDGPRRRPVARPTDPEQRASLRGTPSAHRAVRTVPPGRGSANAHERVSPPAADAGLIRTVAKCGAGGMVATPGWRPASARASGSSQVGRNVATTPA